MEGSFELGFEKNTRIFHFQLNCPRCYVSKLFKRNGETLTTW